MAGTVSTTTTATGWSERTAGGLAVRVMAISAFVVSCFLRPDIALGLVVLGVVFTVAERVRPLHVQPLAIERKGAATDACHFVVDEILAAAGLIAVLVVVMPLVRAVVPDVVPDAIRAQPTWATWMESLLAAEVAGYWGHRLTHQVPFLWRFHRVHHSSTTLDWLAPSRRHPVDQVIARVSVAIPILAMGFAVPTIVTHFAIKRFQGLLVHANVDIRLGATRVAGGHAALPPLAPLGRAGHVGQELCRPGAPRGLGVRHAVPSRSLAHRLRLRRVGPRRGLRRPGPRPVEPPPERTVRFRENRLRSGGGQVDGRWWPVGHRAPTGRGPTAGRTRRRVPGP